MQSGPRITLIAACAQQGAIGRGNALPWHLPEDLQHFKATTLGHAIIMGRRTFESIGRPLPGRRTLVITRNAAWQHPGCERSDSLAAALALCPNDSEVFIAGGGEIYAQAIAHADRLLITEVELAVADADTFFPAIDPTLWQRNQHAPHLSRSGLRYAISDWQRRPT